MFFDEAIIFFRIPIFIVRKTKEEVLQSFFLKFVNKIAKSTEDIINYKKILKIITNEFNR